MKRVKIHVKRVQYSQENMLSIHEMDGSLIQTCKKIELKGNWVIRQYNNPVPCDETIVLYPANDDASYWVVH